MSVRTDLIHHGIAVRYVNSISL